MSTEKIIEVLKHEKIAILGYGREGQSTYRFLRHLFPDREIGIADRNEEALKNAFEIIREPVVLFGGEHYVENLAQAGYTSVFKSPGIPLKAIDDKISQSCITSQTELFLKAFKNRIVGITGTKGKSTTTALLAHMLKACGFDAVAAGNIGKPVLDLFFTDVPDRLYIFEMSSHMLETIRESPKYAILLNIYEEHLDHYRSFNDYAQAKLNLFRYQSGDCFAVAGANVFGFTGGKLPGQGKSLFFNNGPALSCYTENGAFIENGRIIFHLEGNTWDIGSQELQRQLPGEHNLGNILACLTLVGLIGTRYLETACRAVRDFNGLPHRLEAFGTYKGIRFYDDSISTIPEAVLCAVKAVPAVYTLVIGGLDRGIDYSPLLDLLASGDIPLILCLPATGHRLHRMLIEEGRDKKARILDAADMEEAVKLAFQYTPEGVACLLSPAAASYGFYKNFEERGDHFKRLVKVYG